MPSPSLTDYPRRMAAVLFVSGCNFRCGFCHNAALLGLRRPGLSWEQLEAQCDRWRDQWVDAAVISGGEPTLSEGLEELVVFLKGLGWAVKLDTNGSRPDALRRVVEQVDYVAMDIKAPLRDYPAVTGFTQTDLIRESIGLIRERAADYEFRSTVVDELHTEEQIAEMAALVHGARRYVLQPFVPRDDLPAAALRGAQRPSAARMRRLRDLIGAAAGEVAVRGG